MKKLIAKVVSSAMLATPASVSAIASALPDGGPCEEKVGDKGMLKMIRGVVKGAVMLTLGMAFCLPVNASNLSAGSHRCQSVASQSGNALDEYSIKVEDGYKAVVEFECTEVDNVSGTAESCSAMVWATGYNHSNLSGGLRQTYEFTDDATITVKVSASAATYQDVTYYWNPVLKQYVPRYINRQYSSYALYVYYTITVSYVQLLPDVAVSKVSLSTAVAAVGEEVTLSYDVTNVGLVESSETTAAVYDGETLIGEIESVPSLASGKKHSVTMTLPELTAVKHVLSVQVEQVPNETATANNTASVDFRRYERVPINLIFDVNGGDGGCERTITAGDSVGEFPSVSRGGYTLVRWAAAGSEGVAVAVDEKIVDPTTFVAVWEPIKCVVMLNRQEGSGGDVEVECTYDAALPTVSVPARTGYVFDGYWSEVDGGGIQYFSADGNGVCSWNITHDKMTLYAKWIPISTEVTLDQQGGTGGTGSANVSYGDSLPNISPPAQSGWSFQGYYASSNGVGRQFWNAAGVGVGVWDQLPTNGLMTVYADWLPRQMEYVVTFDRQNGTGGSESVTATYRSLIPEITPPAREQYVFEGYYTEPDGGGDQYYDAEGHGLMTWLQVREYLCLYAKWSKAYRVVLDANDGSGSQVTNYFASADWTLMENPFTSAECVFAGWGLSADGVPVFADAQSVNRQFLGYGDDPDADCITLYAMWGSKLESSEFPDWEFVTGGDAGGWFEEDGKLRSAVRGGTSWLTAIFDNGGEANWTCGNDGLDALRSNEGNSRGKYDVVWTDDEAIYTNLYCSGEMSATIPNGTHLLTWMCHKSITDTTLRTNMSEVDESELAQIIRNREAEYSATNALFKMKAIALIRAKCYSWSSEQQENAEYHIDYMLDKYRSGESIGGLSGIISRLSDSGGFSVSTLRQAVNNHSNEGNEVLRLYADMIELLDELVSLDSYANGCAWLSLLSWQTKWRVGFVVDDGSNYNLALAEDAKRERYLSVIEEKEAELTKGIVDLLSRYGTSDSKEAKVAEVVNDVYDDRRTGVISWGGSTALLEEIVHRIANIGYNVSDLTDALGYDDHGGGIGAKARTSAGRQLCELSMTIVEKTFLVMWSDEDIIDYGVLEWREVVDGAAVGSLPEPTRSGYTFDGWWTSPTGGEEVTDSTEITSDTVLYAHWNVIVYHVTFDSNGGTNCEMRDIEYEGTLGVLPVPTRSGYQFAGWYNATNGNNAISMLSTVDSDVTYHAQWTLEYYGITYVLDGGVNAAENPSMYTIEDEVALVAPTRSGYIFKGWTSNGKINKGSTGDKTFVASWEVSATPEPDPTPTPDPDPVPDPEPTVDPDPDPTPTPDPEPVPSVVDEVTPISADAAATFAATTYNGYLCREADGVVVGTVQVKAAKAKANKKTGKTTSKLTISVQMAASTKKVSISGEYDLTTGGEQTFTPRSGSPIKLLLGTNGLTGSYGDYVIEGVPNVFTAKDATSKAAANAANEKYVGVYNLVADEGTFTISVMKKGKVKVTGTTTAGKSVSVSTQLIVGSSVACVPVMVPKYDLAFTVWFGDEISVDGLTDGVIGKAGNIAATSTFSLDVASVASALKSVATSVFTDYLPNGATIANTGKKWIVMPDANGKAAKAGKIVLAKDGSVDTAKSKIDGYNVSALKLTYTAKTGAFKGSFYVYTLKGTKLKKLTAKVAGIVVDGVGYGTATIKGAEAIAIVIK